MNYSQKTGPEWLASRERRSLEIAVVSYSLPLAIPLGAATSTLLAYELGESPFISQERIGSYPELPLSMPKLKTLAGPVTNGLSTRGFNHGRAGPIGKRIRQLHLDELPQAALVLQGRMSLVGPRPLTPIEFEQTMDILSPAEQNEFLTARRIAKPGMIWPGGDRQHTHREDVEFEEKVLLTIDYVATSSLKNDASLIMSSLGSVIQSNLRDLAERKNGAL